MEDKSTNEICILKRCGFKTQRQIKIKANSDILEKLELSQELIDSKDDGDNIFICLQHLHPVINGLATRKDCAQYWLEKNKLPDRFIVGFQNVPLTYKISSYRKLQNEQKSKPICYNGTFDKVENEVSVVSPGDEVVPDETEVISANFLVT